MHSIIGIYIVLIKLGVSIVSLLANKESRPRSIYAQEQNFKIHFLNDNIPTWHNLYLQLTIWYIFNISKILFMPAYYCNIEYRSIPGRMNNHVLNI